MKLLSNWQDVLTRAWSMRFIILSVVLGSIEVMLPTLGDILLLPERTFAALSVLVMAAAGFARVIAQDNLPPKEPAPETLPVDLPDEIEQ